MDSLLREFDPLSLGHPQPKSVPPRQAVSKAADPLDLLSFDVSPSHNNAFQANLVKQVDSRNAALLGPLHEELSTQQSIAAKARVGSPPRRLSWLMSSSSSQPTPVASTSTGTRRPDQHRRGSEASVTSGEIDLFQPSASPVGSSYLSQRYSEYDVRKRGRRRSDSYSDFIQSETVATSPPKRRTAPIEPDITTAVTQTITDGWHAITKAASLPSSATSTMPRQNSGRAALDHLFADSTFAYNDNADQSAAKEPPHSAPIAKYISGAPGFDVTADRENRRDWNSQHWKSPSTPLPLNLIRPVPAAAVQLLSNDLAEGLRPNLPSRLRLASTWSMLYSLDSHGVSLATLYTRVAAGMSGRNGSAVGCLLVVQDTRGSLFGAFTNEALRKHDGYYGNGEWSALLVA